MIKRTPYEIFGYSHEHTLRRSYRNNRSMIGRVWI